MKNFELTPEEITALRFAHKKERRNVSKAYRINAVILLGSGWTVRQVVHHTVDSHLNAYLRFKRVATEENPTILPYDQAAHRRADRRKMQSPAHRRQNQENWGLDKFQIPRGKFAHLRRLGNRRHRTQ